jgi:hypothetical protein
MAQRIISNMRRAKQKITSWLLILAISGFSSNICTTEGGGMMSRDWTPTELQAASEAMKASGNLSYKEFCEETEKSTFTAYCKDADGNLIKISGPFKTKDALRVF